MSTDCFERMGLSSHVRFWRRGLPVALYGGSDDVSYFVFHFYFAPIVDSFRTYPSPE